MSKSQKKTPKIVFHLYSDQITQHPNTGGKPLKGKVLYLLLNFYQNGCLTQTKSSKQDLQRLVVHEFNAEYLHVLHCFAFLCFVRAEGQSESLHFTIKGTYNNVPNSLCCQMCFLLFTFSLSLSLSLSLSDLLFHYFVCPAFRLFNLIESQTY